MPNAPEDLGGIIENLYRSESSRILATLVRLLGDLDLAEEAKYTNRRTRLVQERRIRVSGGVPA